MTIPTVANWTIQAGGISAYTRKVNKAADKAGRAVAGIGGSVVGNTVGRLFR